MLTFAAPYMFWLALVVPMAVGLYATYRHWRRRKLTSIGSEGLLQQILLGTDNARHLTKFTLQLLAFLLMVIAAARPQVATMGRKEVFKGGDIMICLDVSNSMMAEDIKPNRLVRAKQAVSSLLKQLEEEQAGLVVFAGEAYIQVPLTIDKGTAVMLLNTINVSDIGYQGTAIADAISLATRSFGSTPGMNRNRSIILVTDGEDHEGNVREEAKLAAEQGIVIYTLGIGDPGGAPIPVYQDGLLTGYKKDADGNAVVSTLNPGLLTEVAEVSGGKFYLSPNLGMAMQRIRAEINNRKSHKREVHLPDHYTPQYGWFAGLALLLIAVDLMIPYRGSRRRVWERMGV